MTTTDDELAGRTENGKVCRGDDGGNAPIKRALPSIYSRKHIVYPVYTYLAISPECHRSIRSSQVLHRNRSMLFSQHAGFHLKQCYRARAAGCSLVRSLAQSRLSTRLIAFEFISPFEHGLV